MSKQLTPEQSAKLAEIAKGVKGSYRSLPIADVLNRIHFITNRDYRKCIEGLKLMLSEWLIDANFVTGIETLPNLERAVDRAMPIMEALQTELISVTVADGPTDDADEGWTEHPIAPKPKPLDLSHVNANF